MNSTYSDYDYNVITTSDSFNSLPFISISDLQTIYNELLLKELNPEKNRLNRNASRKMHKKFNRAKSIKNKIARMFRSCGISILDTLSSTELIYLRDVATRIFVKEDFIEYYPIPKTVHRKIRKYVHDHPNEKEGKTLDYFGLWL